MSASYEQMWEKLNLDVDAHAGLLEVLGKFLGDIYLSQQGRLQGMEYLDFVLSEVHGLRIKELQEAKAEGKKVVGTFCVFVPEEIVLAAGGFRSAFVPVPKSVRVKPRRCSPEIPAP